MLFNFDAERNQMATKGAAPSIPAAVGASGKFATPVPDISGQLVVTKFCSLSLGPCDCSLVLTKIQIGSHSVFLPIAGDKLRPNRMQPFGCFVVAVVGGFTFELNLLFDRCVCFVRV